MFKKSPGIIVFFATYRCNARCIMCSIWQKQDKFTELSLDLIEEIFNDKVLNRNLEIVNFTGGEPTLRPDFDRVIKIIVESCPKLKRIDIPTNGIETDRVLDRIQRALAVIYPYPRIKLTTTVALDGIGVIHEEIRGIPGCFKRISNTIDGLKEYATLYPNFSLSLNTVINKINYNRLQEIRKFAKEKNVYLNYTLGAISEIGVESIRNKDKFYIDAEKTRAEVAKFINDVRQHGEISLSYADFLLSILNGGERNIRCAFRERKAILLDADGKVYACGNYKKFYIGDLEKDRFKNVWMNAKIPKSYWRICKKCESNCYWDGM